MISQCFSLKPFPSADILPHLKITGNISRRSVTLAINYELSGPLAKIVVPAPADMPSRKNALWKETCFEIFFYANNSDEYREFNLSPSGYWNVFRFESYRKGMQEEPAFSSLPLSVQRQPDSLQLSLELDIDKIITADQILKVAVSAVIKHINGRITYWALTHPGPQADFHRRDSFIIEL
jgi:hypothetical protein